MSKYGQKNLELEDVAEPIVGPKDVLIAIEAAGLNPLDQMIKDGEFKALLPHNFPLILGHDVAGKVLQIGSAVTNVEVGDSVFSRPRDLRIGAFAERISIDQADIAKMPKNLSFQEAASVPLVALASWQILVDLAKIQPGAKVLIHAGAGGLGSTLIQLAKHLGAYVATTSSAKNIDFVTELGADEVVDYKVNDFEKVFQNFDLVVDTVGGKNLDKSLNCLRSGGLAVSVVGPPEANFATQLGKKHLAPLMSILSASVRSKAKKIGVEYRFFFMRADGEQLAKLAKLYELGTLRPVIDRTFPFDKTMEALAYLAQGSKRGKVVITH